MVTDAVTTTFIPDEVCWTPALATRARREARQPVTDAKRLATARLDRDAYARQVFVGRWDVQAAFFVRCERHAHLFAADPYAIDAAVIELRSLARFTTADHWHHFRGIIQEIEGIAARTRTFRLQLHLACPVNR